MSRRKFWPRIDGVRDALLLIAPKQRKKLLLLVLVQMFLGALDLVAVGLVGVIGTLAITSAQANAIGAGGTIGRVLELLGISDRGLTDQIVILAAIATVLFIGRTFASIQLTRRALHFLAVRTAEASSDLIARLLAQPITFLQTRTSQDFLFATTSSVVALMLGVLGSMVTLAADVSLLIALVMMMLYASWVVAVVVGVLLVLLVLALHRLTTARAHSLGKRGAEFDIASRDLFIEAISTFREMQVRGSSGLYAAAIRRSRMDAAWNSAEWQFLPNVSKYVLETAVILGSLFVGAVEFAISDAQHAVGVLSLFLAAGTRLAPAIIRIQQGMVNLRGSLGQGSYALSLLQSLEPVQSTLPCSAVFKTSHEGFQPRITLNAVAYSYPAAQRSAVEHLTLDVEPGQLVAFVGPSGAGKSTAADLVLGVLKPSSGEVLLSGVAPALASQQWPGAIGYVPQDVWIADGSFRKNVCLGYDPATVPDDAVWQALDRARLSDVVRQYPAGLDAVVGERGARLSGGQRQRLGIARALVTSPLLLVMDEATSALDAETEHEVNAAIQGLRGQVTLLVIAHRLAVVRGADAVVYIEDGHALAIGSFESVRTRVPQFDKQASLLGL